MVVLVEDAAEMVCSADVQPGEAVGVGDGCGQPLQGSGIGDALVRAMPVVERLVLARRVQEMPLVPDECPAARGGRWAPSV
jgi:hypothetical protein